MPEEQHEQTASSMAQIIATLEQLSTRINNIEASNIDNQQHSSLPMGTSDHHVPDFEGTEDEFLTEQAPNTLLQPYPALVEAIPGMAKDFVRQIMDEDTRCSFLHECPCNTGRQYAPPPLNQGLGLTPRTQQLDRQLRLVQYRLSGITRPIDLFAHDTIRGHQVDGPTALCFANTIHMLLSDVASLITNIRTEFVCKETGLSSSPITAPGHLPNNPLLDTSQVLEQTKLTQALRKLSRYNHTTRRQNGVGFSEASHKQQSKAVQSPKQLFQGTVGGRLSSFSSAWTSLSSSPWIRRIIKDGFSIPFHTAPPTFQHHQHHPIHHVVL
ncbi:hypothetical protein BDC45DRAFT_576372 [Circinella umbellata]|nr:hypothetical protein BDC45DRAFT_576372 [Circinella umbellata]